MATNKVSIEKLWAEANFRPNDKQKEAIRHTTGPLFLTAGPGSGKTRVLLWRTVNLIVFEKIRPDEIFLGTFTEKGAHQLREGLRGLLSLATHHTNEPYDISNMAIGTIHSICRKLLVDRRLSSGGEHARMPVLLDAFAQYQFIYRARNWGELLSAGKFDTATANSEIKEFFTDRQGRSRHDAVVLMQGFFNRLSEESVDPKKVKSSDSTVKRMLKMYDRYLDLLATGGDHPKMDLSLLQHRAYERLLGSDAAPTIFKHIIVDEYQDTNAIQEKIYFRLASGNKNVCVVGDDDQALYRFRGATVDNFLAFPDRCRDLLKTKPTVIPLVKNYRSRKQIVTFYNEFMSRLNWRHNRKSFRVDKTIEANSTDRAPAVFASAQGIPDRVAEEVAKSVKKLIAQKAVNNENEIAFLFPSLGSTHVTRMRAALEREGLKVYAPRAGSFLQVEEAKQVFGLYLMIFGNPGHTHTKYSEWLDEISAEAKAIIKSDPKLARFVQSKQKEIEQIVSDEHALLDALKRAKIDTKDSFSDSVGRTLSGAKELSDKTRRFLNGASLSAYLRHQKERRPDRPITVQYVINRACSLDWGVLDLFYQLTAFDALKSAFDEAEKNGDEGPICNLSMISDYLSRYQEQTSPVIAAQFLSDGIFSRMLFGSYLYSIFRLDESEYEDEQDPFPKGRIPFLTIHQAKGLEFPVVVLGNLRKDNNGARKIDEVVAELCPDKQEPLDFTSELDIRRLFYVALSRPKKALILCPYRGQGQRVNDEFQGILSDFARPLSELDPKTIQREEENGQGIIPRPYSFTGDYISYKICPRRYMIYRHYNLVPSRSQTMMFGNLVHRTIEDLHQWLMRQKAPAKK